MIRTATCRILPKVLAGILLVGWVHRASALSPDISDSAISNVINSVANHWQHPLADGSYPVATHLPEAQAAAEPVGINWEYAWGVNLAGQLHVTDATGNQTFENFVLNHNLICARYFVWLKDLTNTLADTSGLRNFQRKSNVLGTFFILDRLDYCGAMAAQMLEGALHHAKGLSSEELQMAKTTADHICKVQSRLPDGTLWRSTAQGGTIWGDDLYMSCPFLVRWYQHTGDTNLLNDAAQQVINMAGYLQDTNGLWFHGYYQRTHSVNGIKWGRANGWEMIATTDVLSVLPANHPARSKLLDILRRHIAGVETVQASDGMWHQVLDHPEVWEETSCTAMYAYSIARAVNHGWIDATNMAVARKAFAAIAQMEVSPTGVVSNICPGTSLNTNIAYYTNKISLPPTTDDRHGPGLVMLAGAEILLAQKTGAVHDGNPTTASPNLK